MLLVDTSVWVEIFAKPARLDLASITPIDEVVLCLPVVEEILQGFRDESAQRRARRALLAFPILESPMSQEVFLEAADLYRAARRAGITVRSSVDCLVAACAIRHHIPVAHRDRDYDALARVSAHVSRRC